MSKGILDREKMKQIFNLVEKTFRRDFVSKVFGFFAVVSLALSLVVGAPLYSSATTNSSNQEVELAASKVVTMTKYYGLNDSIPSSLKYSLGGWSGTLKLQSTQSTGDGIIARYSGTVHCSGPCVLSESVDLE